MHDLKELKLNNNIVDVIGRFVPLKKSGSEYYGVCPFHNDDKESLQVNESKQIFKCFACGRGGDVMDFLIKWGMTWGEMVKELADPANSTNSVFAGQKTSVGKPQQTHWRDAVPNGASVEIKHYLHGVPNMVWAYRNANGIATGYACRFDQGEGRKMVIPFVYKAEVDGPKREWRWQGFDKLRPLYNLDKLAASPKTTAVIVEGEKTADAADRLIATGIATTWMGGADGIKTVDLTPLYGRKIVLWADNDYTHAYKDKHPKAGQVMPLHEQPGNKAMLAIYELLKPHCKVIKWVRQPEGTPCGWDVADSDWTPDQALDYVKKNLVDVPTPETEVVPHEPINAEVNHTQDFGPPQDQDDPYHTDNQFFRCLGYEKAETGGQFYYFYAYIARSVIKLAPSSMSKSNLMQIAPLNYWESAFPGKQGLSIDAAQNWLIQKCHDVGIFNEKWIRGRGAWMDKQTTVIHAGNHLIVNGTPTAFSNYKSKYIYEIGDELGFYVDSPLNNTDASRLMEVLNKLKWERAVNSYLLAGWCVVAPVCGALNWRPHIWLHGAAGSGKSWVFLEIVRRLLGPTAFAVQGETSEAGLRQVLKHDALPIVFDEAEGNERKDQERIQGVLALMRQSSATDGGVMAKGTAGGTAKTYRVRSCFAFASIAIQIAQHSDHTRITKLGLLKDTDRTEGEQKRKKERWEALQAKYHEVITDEFCDRLRARTIQILPTILKNARTFANAAAAVLGEQRAGDQVGALLAGAYSLSSSREITYDDAVKWVSEKDWSEERAHTANNDELSLVAYIMEHITGIETGVGRLERSVGELMQSALGYRDDSHVTIDAARDRLKRLGIRVEDSLNNPDPFVAFSDSATTLKKILENTPWARNHSKILLRIETAEAVAGMRFAAGVTTRAVKIKANKILE